MSNSFCEVSSAFKMSFQVYFVDLMKRNKTEVSVANSEEEFMNTTVEELKRKLFPKDGDYKSCVLRCINTTLFHDDRTLGFYGVKHNDVIEGFMPPPFHKELFSYEPEDEEFEAQGGILRTESMEKITLNM